MDELSISTRSHPPPPTHSPSSADTRKFPYTLLSSCKREKKAQKFKPVTNLKLSPNSVADHRCVWMRQHLPGCFFFQPRLTWDYQVERENPREGKGALKAAQHKTGRKEEAAVGNSGTGGEGRTPPFLYIIDTCHCGMKQRGLSQCAGMSLSPCFA